MREKMKLALLSLLLPALTVSGRIIEDYQNDDYLGDYDEANYDDDDDHSVEIKESESDRTPKFISSSKNFIVNEGDSIKLPCLVDNLENLIIIWKKGTKIVTLGDKPYEDDDKRIQVENVWKETNKTDDDDATEEEKVQVGNTLVIRLSEENDAGDYTCQVSSANNLELKHSVKIIVQPAIEPIPASRLVTVKAGEAAELSCKVTRGDPEPEVFWRRKDKPLPSGKSSMPGTSITFPKTSRHHAGLYTCYADNNWREPATATIELDVQHAPEIDQQVMLVENQGETDLRLICTVHASPMATVKWYKDNQLMVVKDNVISKRGNRHTLLLMGVTQEDVTGIFECKANNIFGEASAVLEMPFDATDERLPAFKTAASGHIENSLKEENSKEKSLDAVLNVKENDRTQHVQDTIKIPLEQNTDGIDLENEGVGSEDSDHKNKDKQSTEEESGISSSAANLNGEEVIVKKEDNTSEEKTDNGEKDSTKDTQGNVSKEVSNAEKFQDSPDTSSCVKFSGKFCLYLILPVLYILGL